jgi:hypothetical protein
MMIDRDELARHKVMPHLQAICDQKGIKYPPSRLLLRAFKATKQLELWASNSPTNKLKLLKSYKVLAASGKLGPKRKEGDRQVPEGVYFINRFNPKSQFHLSLSIIKSQRTNKANGQRQKRNQHKCVTLQRLNS